MTEHDSSERRSKLIEFESGSSTALAPFETCCTVLLDVFGMDVATGLEEFENSLEVVLLNERPDEERSTEPDESEEREISEEKREEPVEEFPPEFEKAVGEEREPGEEIPEEEPPEEKEPAEPLPEPPREPVGPVIGFVCRHAVDPEGLADENGRMYTHPVVYLIEVPCAGMVKPDWLTRIIGGKASGAFVVSCSAGVCHHRSGAAIIADRLKGMRRPMPVGRFDRKRLRLIVSHPQSRRDLLEAIDGFVAELGKLDEEEVRYIPEIEEEPKVEFEEPGPYTGLM